MENKFQEYIFKIMGLMKRLPDKRQGRNIVYSLPRLVMTAFTACYSREKYLRIFLKNLKDFRKKDPEINFILGAVEVLDAEKAWQEFDEHDLSWQAKVELYLQSLKNPPPPVPSKRSKRPVTFTPGEARRAILKKIKTSQETEKPLQDHDLKIPADNHIRHMLDGIDPTIFNGLMWEILGEILATSDENFKLSEKVIVIPYLGKHSTSENLCRAGGLSNSYLNSSKNNTFQVEFFHSYLGVSLYGNLGGNLGGNFKRNFGTTSGVTSGENMGGTLGENLEEFGGENAEEFAGENLGKVVFPQLPLEFLKGEDFPGLEPGKPFLENDNKASAQAYSGSFVRWLGKYALDLKELNPLFVLFGELGTFKALAALENRYSYILVLNQESLKNLRLKAPDLLLQAAPAFYKERLNPPVLDYLKQGGKFYNENWKQDRNIIQRFSMDKIEKRGTFPQNLRGPDVPAPVLAQDFGEFYPKDIGPELAERKIIGVKRSVKLLPLVEGENPLKCPQLILTDLDLMGEERERALKMLQTLLQKDIPTFLENLGFPPERHFGHGQKSLVDVIATLNFLALDLAIMSQILK